MKEFKGYLMVSDMDGTLLNSKGIISEENIKAIKEFMNMGGKFAFATGRMRESTKKFLKHITPNAPVILYNGALVYDYENEQIIEESYLEEEVKLILKEINKFDASIGIEIYCNDNVYIYHSNKYTDRFSQKGYMVSYEITEELIKDNWTKVLLTGDKEVLDIIEGDFKNKFGDFNIVRSDEVYLEIIPREVSKGKALERLCKHLNIPMENTIAVGDNMNDIEMLERAKYGFCVESGNPRVLERVKYVAENNDNHSASYVIKYLLQKLEDVENEVE